MIRIVLFVAVMLVIGVSSLGCGWALRSYRQEHENRSRWLVKVVVFAWGTVCGVAGAAAAQFLAR